MIAHVAVFGRRSCAVLAACSAVLHGFSLVHATSSAAAVLTVFMLAACLFCARGLWAHGTLRAWAMVALMNLAMIAIHAPASAPHEHGVGVIAAERADHSQALNLATMLAAVEVVIAAAVLYYRTRASRPTGLSIDGRQLETRPPASFADTPRSLAVGP